MDSDWYIVTLRLVHIIAGVLWAGAGIFIAFLLEPVLSDMGRDGGRVMQGLVHQRKLPQFMAISALLTILAGALLYWRDSGNLEWEWVKSGPGIFFTIGGILSIIVAVWGGAYNGPTAKKMAAIGEKMAAGSGPPDPADVASLSTLSNGLRNATRYQATLLIIITATMAVARYIVR